MGYLRTLSVLLRKNFVLSIRDYGSVAIQVVTTFLAILILYLSQVSLDDNKRFRPELRENRNPETVPIAPIPRCIPRDTDTCYTLAYVPDNNPDVTRYVGAVRATNDIPESEVRGFSTSQALNSFIVNNPNRTQAAYLFEQRDLDAIAARNVSFVVQVNLHRQDVHVVEFTDFQERVVGPAMLHAMNRVIMQDLGTNLDLTYSISIFPHPKLFGVENAFSNYGPLLLQGVFFISFVLFLYKIVDEKERGLRDYMKLSGLLQSQHYISWVIPFLLSFLVSTLLIVLFGTAFRFEFFTKTNFFVYFCTLWLYGFALTGWVFLFDVFTRRSQQVPLFAFNFFILSYLLSATAAFVYVVNKDGEPIISDSVLFLRHLFAIIPPVMFHKAITDIAHRAATGFGLSFEDAITYSDVFPVRDCWKWMAGSGVVAFLIAMYLDNVVPRADGTGLSPMYLFSPEYWGISRKSAEAEMGTSDEDDDVEAFETARPASASLSDDETTEDRGVTRERECIASSTCRRRPLVVKNLCKTYGSFKAVDNISFSVPRNSVTSILGPNGSGKSTTLNMISTSLRITSGDAFMYGRSVRTEQDAIRKMLGICPQFDVYWERLTAKEHIDIFATLKGMVRADCEREIELRLHQVGLTGAASRQVGSFSGGMQRRLSVCLALTGNPTIVMLDECTTGTDPISRRDLWRIMETAKRDRVVILVTHSMEEAEALSDQILILTRGKIRAMGTALQLKNMFGAGYRVIVATNSTRAAEIVGVVISQECPDGTAQQRFTGTEDGRPDAVIAEYELPRVMTDEEMIRVVRVLELRQEELRIARFSVNHTDLDTVFKRIAARGNETESLAQGLIQGTKCVPKCCECC